MRSKDHDGFHLSPDLVVLALCTAIVVVMLGVWWGVGYLFAALWARLCLGMERG